MIRPSTYEKELDHEENVVCRSTRDDGGFCARGRGLGPVVRRRRRLVPTSVRPGGLREIRQRRLAGGAPRLLHYAARSLAVLEALSVRRAALYTLLLGAGIALGACTSMGSGSGF